MSARVENSWGGFGFPPIITFIKITAKTGIDQIFRLVRAIKRLRLKMVNRQFAARVRLADAAVFAGKIRPRSDLGFGFL